MCNSGGCSFDKLSNSSQIFSLMKDNLCNNALDLTNGQLIIQENWSYGIILCPWLILAQEDDAYVTLEFLYIHVNIS